MQHRIRSLCCMCEESNRRRHLCAQLLQLCDCGVVQVLQSVELLRELGVHALVLCQGLQLHAIGVMRVCTARVGPRVCA